MNEDYDLTDYSLYLEYLEFEKAQQEVNEALLLLEQT